MRLRRVRQLSIAVTIIVAFYFLQALIVPGVVRDQAMKQAAAANVTLEVPRIIYNPFRCRLELYEVAARLNDGPALVALGSAHVNLSFWGSLFRLGVALDELRLEQPALTVHREDDGSIQWSRIGGGQPAEPEVDQLSEDGLRLFVARAEVIDGRIGYSEPSHPTRYRTALESLDFTLENVDTALGEPGPFRIDFDTERQGEVVLEGTIVPQPWLIDGLLTISDVPLAPGWRYVDHAQPLSLRGGALDASIPWRVGFTNAGLDASIDAATVSLSNLTMAWEGEAGDALSLDRLELGPLDFSLEARTLDLGALRLAGLTFAHAAANTEGLLALGGDGASTEDAAPEPATEAAITGEPFIVRLPLVRLEEADFSYRDASFPTPFELSLAVTEASLTDFDSTEPGALPLKLSGFLNETAPLSVDGVIQWASAAAQVDVSLQSFSLAALNPLLLAAAPVRLDGGDVEAQLSIDTAKNELAASASVSELVTRLANADEATLASAASITVTDLTSGLDGSRLRLAEVTLTDVDLAFEQAADGTTTLDRLLPASSPDGEAEARASGNDEDADAALIIDAITLDGIRLDVRDASVSPAFRTALTDLGGRITGLGTERLEIDLDGRIDEQAPIRIIGEQRAGASAGLSLALSTENVELTPFSGYAGKYLGYRLRRGKLETTLDYQIDGRKLTGRNELLLLDFELGETVESEEALSVPLKLGLALLRDLDGQIRIDLPVSGDLDDPAFSVGGIVVKAFVNLIVKLAASPFSILGSLIPGGGDDLQHVTFAPGAASLDESQTTTLNQLAEALRQRPSLTLEVPGLAQRDADGEALARLRLAESLGLTAPSTAAYEQAVTARYLERFPPAPAEEEGAGTGEPREEAAAPSPAATPTFAAMEATLLGDFPVEDEALRELARQRSRAIVELFAADPALATRVFALEPTVTGDPAVLDGTEVQLELAVDVR